MPTGTSSGDRSPTVSPPQGSVSLTGSSSPPGPQTAVGLTATPTGPPTPLAAAPLTASLELRDLLDPATVADLGRLDHGRAPSSVAALQRAVAALRARAAAIDTQAAAMRHAAQKH